MRLKDRRMLHQYMDYRRMKIRDLALASHALRARGAAQTRAGAVMGILEVRWLAASGLLIGAGLALMWAGGKLDPTIGRVLDALEDAMCWEEGEALSLA